MPHTYAEFLKAYPTYESTSKLDELRETEFARFDQQGHVYLDYTGAGVYGDSQIRRHIEMLCGSVFGNPHSQNPTSAFTTELVERCRARVLRFLNASPEEYGVVFTANATHALDNVSLTVSLAKGSRAAGGASLGMGSGRVAQARRGASPL